jgi:hypothetical protein
MTRRKKGDDDSAEDAEAVQELAEGLEAKGEAQEAADEVDEEPKEERLLAFAAEVARRVVALPTNTTSSGVTEDEVKAIVLAVVAEEE